MSKVSKKLQQTWRWRIEQQHEQALEGYVELAGLTGLPFGSEFKPDEIIKLCTAGKPEDIIDTILLKASLRRMQKSFSESRDLVNLCDQLVSKMGIKSTYRLYFEKGLNFFATGDFTNALDCFLAATKSKKESDDYSTWERLCAELNSLLCFENLGIPATEMLRKIDASVAKLGKNATDGVLSQIEAYQLRSDFRQGLVSQTKIELNSKDPSNQSTYFKLWIARLPYHRYALPQKDFGKKLAEFCVNQDLNLFMKNFRLRTLQGIQHTDDSAGFIKPSEWVDRFYLWTWCWLQDPNSWPLSKVMPMLERLRSDDFISRLTVEDQQLLINTLSWLDLFDQQQDHQTFIQKWAISIDNKFPIFELEHLCIAYLKARRDREDHLADSYYEQLTSHPLWHSKDLYFRMLIEEVRGDSGSNGSPNSFSSLTENLIKLIGISGQSTAAISVDFSTFKITNSESQNSTTTSEPLCRALEVIRKYHVTTKEKLLAASFGLRSYDMVLHDQKIYNLLQRLNKICRPYIQFRTKEGKIYSEGAWDRVQIVNRQLLSDQLGENRYWRSFFSPNGSLDSTPESRDVSSKKSLAIPGEMKTKDLQNILGKSRATTNRLIGAWEKQRLIKRQGKARATKLILTPELIAKISNDQSMKNEFIGGRRL